MSIRANTAPFAAYLRERSRPVRLYEAMQARKSKVGQTTVENWFRGGSLPQAQYLLALSDALGVPCAEVCRVCADNP